MPTLVRILALAQKELLHMLRDRQVIYLALGMPLVLVILFGYAVSFDVEGVSLAVVDQDHSPASRALIERYRGTRAFAIRDQLASPDEVESLFRRGEVKAALVIPPDFARQLARGKTAPYQLLLDGSDGTSTQIAMGYSETISQQQTMAQLKQLGLTGNAPLMARVRTWYNPAMRSALFVVPGLVAIVVGILSILLTALTVAREWERGSMEQLFTTPVGRLAVVLGKLLPYVLLGLLQMLLVLFAGAWLFDMPLVGSFWLLLLFILPFLVCVLSQGLLISMITRNQQVAVQAGAVSGMLPALLVSGFLFPISNMPLPLQGLSFLVPARYMIAALRGVLLQGFGLAQLWPQLLGMCLLALLLVTASTLKFRRRLD